MMGREPSMDESIGSAAAAAGLLGALLLVVAHPLLSGFVLVTAGVVAVAAVAAWRQVRGRGLSLPGTGGRLCIETVSGRGQWVMTVSVIQN